ncbi:MAG: glycosyltransferase family 4 protein [Chthonomonadales bacterium]
MRVLYFYQYFTTPKGCWSTRAYEFARRWVACGHTVTVVTSVYDKSDLKPRGLVSRFMVDGITVIVLNVRLSNKHGKLMRICTFAAYACLASWYALVLPADVVLASSGPITVGLPALVAHYLRRRPLIFEVRDLWPEGAIQLGLLRNPIAIVLARWLERSCYRAARTVVALSPGMKEWIQHRYGIRNVRVVPNAADNEQAAQSVPLELPCWAQGKSLAVYAGTLGLIDDCSQILECAKVLKARSVEDVAIAIIGDGRERAMLQSRAQEEGLDNVRFVGLIPKEEVMRWLLAANCALFVVRDVPFLATASPNKVFDALAAGVPVVQTSQGWIRDLLEREECGITVPPKDAEALADAVVRLARDRALRARLSHNARRVAQAQFDRGLLAHQMCSILLEAARVP